MWCRAGIASSTVFRYAIVRSGAQHLYKRSGTFSKFGMIFRIPASRRVIKRPQQFLPTNLTVDNFGEESATFSLPKQLIDVTEQTFRQEDMCALLHHGRAPLNVDLSTLAESAHPSSTIYGLRPITSFMGPHDI
jgi:hypothetical protein